MKLRPIVVVLAVLTAAGLQTHLIGENPATSKARNYSEVGPEVEGFQLRISTTNKVFTLGQPIELTISLQNVSTSNAPISVGDGYMFYSITLLGPDGNAVSATSYGERLLRPTVYFHLTWAEVIAGKSYVVPAFLDRLFNVTKTGEYIVNVSRQVPKRDNRKEEVWVSSSPLKIEIKRPKRVDVKPKSKSKGN